MPVILPLTSAGARRLTVNVGPERFIFRAYYVEGQDRHWLLDILDEQERPLLSGINLTPGVDNLLKGRGDALEGYQLHVLTSGSSGSEKDLEAPGSTMTLVWFNPGEENPRKALDPMDAIGTEFW